MLNIVGVNLKLNHNTKLLENINLYLEKGKVYGLLGPNGSGKTLLFKSILGLTDYTGKIEIEKKKVNHKDVGSLIEFPAFYSNLTVEENLKLHANCMRLSNYNIDEILKEVNLLDAKNKRFSNLSLGMKERLGIARAIMNHPKLVLLDEPTNGLDPIGIKSIRLLIKDKLKQKDNCIVVSSHNLTEIEAITDELIFIKKGSIVAKIKNDHNEEVSLENLYEDIIKD